MIPSCVRITLHLCRTISDPCPCLRPIIQNGTLRDVGTWRHLLGGRLPYLLARLQPCFLSAWEGVLRIERAYIVGKTRTKNDPLDRAGWNELMLLCVLPATIRQLRHTTLPSTATQRVYLSNCRVYSITPPPVRKETQRPNAVTKHQIDSKRNPPPPLPPPTRLNPCPPLPDRRPQHGRPFLARLAAAPAPSARVIRHEISSLPDLAPGPFDRHASKDSSGRSAVPAHLDADRSASPGHTYAFLDSTADGSCLRLRRVRVGRRRIGSQR